MFMLMFVLDDPGLLDDLLEAWEKVGVRGATIVESTGIHRRRKKTLPMRYVFQPIGDVEENHCTLFVIVENEGVIKACLKATEQLVGDLNEPNSGVFAAWPLCVVKGISSAAEGEL